MTLFPLGGRRHKATRTKVGSSRGVLRCVWHQRPSMQLLVTVCCSWIRGAVRFREGLSCSTKSPNATKCGGVADPAAANPLSCGLVHHAPLLRGLIRRSNSYATLVHIILIKKVSNYFETKILRASYLPDKPGLTLFAQFWENRNGVNFPNFNLLLSTFVWCLLERQKIQASRILKRLLLTIKSFNL